MGNWRDKTGLFAWSEPQLAPNEIPLEASPLDSTIIEGIGEREGRSISTVALIATFSAAAFALHLLTANRYGYFRDELYYAAGGQHLAWGYVDHAPLIAAIFWFARRLLGDSLFALRLKGGQLAVLVSLASEWGCMPGTTLLSDSMGCEATFQTAAGLPTATNM